MAHHLKYLIIALLILIAPGIAMALGIPMPAGTGDLSTLDQTPLPTELAVYFKPGRLWVNAGDTFSVDLFADLPADVISWDLNLRYDADVLMFQDAIIGPRWDGGSSDGSFIAGAVFMSPPIKGFEVLLASLSFAANGGIKTALSSEISVNDRVIDQSALIQAKGFSPPTLASQLYQIDRFESAEVNINPVPEPATLLLLGLGLVGTGILRSKRKR